MQYVTKPREGAEPKLHINSLALSLALQQETGRRVSQQFYWARRSMMSESLEYVAGAFLVLIGCYAYDIWPLGPCGVVCKLQSDEAAENEDADQRELRDLQRERSTLRADCDSAVKKALRAEELTRIAQ
eukprot:1066929-Amphidinium_carterae.3